MASKTNIKLDQHLPCSSTRDGDYAFIGLSSELSTVASTSTHSSPESQLLDWSCSTNAPGMPAIQLETLWKDRSHDGLDYLGSRSEDSLSLSKILARHAQPILGEVCSPDAEAAFARRSYNLEGYSTVRQSKPKSRMSLGIPSRGSKNHAVHKCRPCKYVNTRAGCPHGVLCNFCHFPHPEIGLKEARHESFSHVGDAQHERFAEIRVDEKDAAHESTCKERSWNSEPSLHIPLPGGFQPFDHTSAFSFGLPQLLV